jgi:cell fate regulator YaaT (PSP1 superfamily)
MQDLGIVPKYKTRMEMTYSNKRTSLQHCDLNYGCKKVLQFRSLLGQTGFDQVEIKDIDKHSSLLQYQLISQKKFYDTVSWNWF